MKAPITAGIGAFVAVLSLVQFVLTGSPVRFVGVAVGLFFLGFGWWIGWTRNRRFTVLLGHLALTAGALVTAWALYQIPFLKEAPGLVEVLDLPLFWGIFTVFGGLCMIQHGTCACCIREHQRRNALGSAAPGQKPEA